GRVVRIVCPRCSLRSVRRALSMLSLRLFGGLSLSNPGSTIPARANQRRRLALLAILAVSPGKPVSRDRLSALLWPEADAEHARHLLSDSLYVLRSALG